MTSHIYIFRQIGKQYIKLKVDLKNDFTAGGYWYSNNRQGILMLLEKYTKTSVIQQTNSEGTSFDQRSGESKKLILPYDKKCRKYMQGFICLYRVNSLSHSTKTITNTNSDKQSGDDKYKSIKSIDSTKTNKSASITKFRNSQI